jgi:hypothetical protein
MSDWKARDIEWRADMRAALAGDSVAYKRLLTALAPFLRRIASSACTRMGMPANDVEDAVQETLPWRLAPRACRPIGSSSREAVNLRRAAKPSRAAP